MHRQLRKWHDYGAGHSWQCSQESSSGLGTIEDQLPPRQLAYFAGALSCYQHEHSMSFILLRISLASSARLHAIISESLENAVSWRRRNKASRSTAAAAPEVRSWIELEAVFLRQPRCIQQTIVIQRLDMCDQPPSHSRGAAIEDLARELVDVTCRDLRGPLGPERGQHILPQLALGLGHGCEVAAVVQVVSYQVGKGGLGLAQRLWSTFRPFRKGISTLVDVSHDLGGAGASIGKSQRWVGAEADLPPQPAAIDGVAIVAAPNTTAAPVGTRRQDDENETRFPSMRYSASLPLPQKVAADNGSVVGWEKPCVTKCALLWRAGPLPVRFCRSRASTIGQLRPERKTTSPLNSQHFSEQSLSTDGLISPDAVRS